MSQKVIVIIPSYWKKAEHGSSRVSKKADLAPYANATAIDDPNPRLTTCLQSLVKVREVGRVIIVPRAEERSLEERASDRTREIASQFSGLDTFVLGSPEVGSLFRRLEQLELSSMIPALEMSGYGSTRNLGLVAAAVHGAEAVVFVDDSEIITSASFVETALFGLGNQIQSGGKLLAKTGFYVDGQGECKREIKKDWTSAFWKIDDAFNRALDQVIKPPRLQQARFAFGGCMSIHKDMYTKIAFDPWIQRGEDTDYVINARMNGADIYIDDNWTVSHQSSSQGNEAAIFRQDAFRFVYEHRKLEFAKSQVDLRQVSPRALAPFPGEFLDGAIAWRAFLTGMLKAIAHKDRGVYVKAGVQALSEAGRYARANCANYFAFQRAWAHLIERLWCDVALNQTYTGEIAYDRSAYSGSFTAV